MQFAVIVVCVVVVVAIVSRCCYDDVNCADVRLLFVSAGVLLGWCCQNDVMALLCYALMCCLVVAMVVCVLCIGVSGLVDVVVASVVVAWMC